MLKTWAAEGLKKARKLDGRTEQEPGNSRTQEVKTIHFNSIDFFFIHKKNYFTREEGVGYL